MIEAGQMTIVDSRTYSCMRIEDGFAYLKDIAKQQGRTRKIRVEECPYIEEGKVIVPKKVKKSSSNVLNISKVIKEHTDLQVSSSAKALLLDWAEGAISCLVSNANANAINLGHSRITAAHIYWLELGTNNLTEYGYWKENEEHFKR